MKIQSNPQDVLASIEKEIAALSALIAKMASGPAELMNPSQNTQYELKARALTNKLSDLISARQMQLSLISAASSPEIKRILGLTPHRMKNFGSRSVFVKMANGSEIELVTPYFARTCLEKKRSEEGDCIQL